MRFYRLGKCEFHDTERKRVTFVCRQEVEREALPLLTGQVAAGQIDADEEMMARRLQWGCQQATDRKCRADKWREARRHLNDCQGPTREALLAYQQGCKWFANPNYFLSMLHMYDTGRLSLNVPKA